MNIYTYFESPGSPILGRWLSSWTANGWSPKILTYSDTLPDTLHHKRLMDRVSTYPTINSREYENICYRRWIPFLDLADQFDGIFVSDYDLINNSLPPFEKPASSIFYCGIPFTFIAKKDLQAIWDTLLNAPLTPPHMSDMTILHTSPIFTWNGDYKIINIPHETQAIHFHGGTKRIVGP